MRKPVTQPNDTKRPGGFPPRVCSTPDPELEPGHKAFQAGDAETKPEAKPSGDEA